MPRLKSTYEGLLQHLARLSVSQRLLIGSLGVIMVMSLFLVSQYAGRPRMVELLEQYTPEQQQRAVNFLRTSSYADRIEDRGGRIYVRPADRTSILAVLSENEALPDDKTLLFANLFESQSMWQTREQHQEALNIATQNELSRIIRKWSGIKDAQVLIDAPPKGGLGATARKPTASVSVHTVSGRLSQKTVDAITSFVAGARAGLDPANVRVIDATTGEQRRALAEDELVSATYMEAQLKYEQQVRQKLSDLLAHIPGVVIAVTAQIDVTQSRVESTEILPTGQGTVSAPSSTTSTERTERGGSKGYEPGVRANASADINGGSRGGVEFSEETREQTFENQFGMKNERTVDPRGYPTRLVATVNVPRGFVLGVLGSKSAEGVPDPTDPQTQAQIEQEWPRIKSEIEASIRPHLAVLLPGGEAPVVRDEDVQVSLIPVDLPAAGVPGGVIDSAGGFGGSVGWMAEGGGVIEKALVGALAVVALGMMLLMVKRAGRRVELPDPQSEVGVPPALRADTDLVGEADESDTPMTGIEVGDSQVRVSKMLEEVGDLVTQNPDDAVKVLSRWISLEE